MFNVKYGISIPKYKGSGMPFLLANFLKWFTIETRGYETKP